MSTAASPSILKQPKSVWAVAVAATIAFMGIGLVDPILPAIAESLEASPTETSLLFTSYLVITGAAMLFTSWLSSRIGVRTTLLAGLAVIVVFAALAGLAGDVGQVIGFRAGWGLGNALFISTALAAIVGAASGGSSAAIVLYEAALGVGLATGPLLGGLLGSISWRGPFFGTAVLMAGAFVAILVLLEKPAQRPVHVPFTAAFRALRVPQILVLGAVALFYNVGFFVLLAYTPFPLGLDAMGIGLVFFGWGLAVAVTSVWLAPILTARMRRTRILLGAFLLLAAILVAAAFLVQQQAALIACVIGGGLVLGVLNTVLTESVMEASDLPRSVASSAYSGIRFLGGACAPPIAASIAAVSTPGAPFVFGAASVVVAAVLIAVFAPVVARIDSAGPESPEVEAEAITLGE
ncbi:putative MFS family arabinose efflux permease [Homoserinimonas aerilata]|uniref:Putative MFS family arabinose efflux permease n=1 Tax=Homoserinimonas aerilata TaxID=1162970 RepID=A0A542YGP0_9MICO|nr:MFS transporter [Homoserinimonas aerilata]TQL47263.1 putative MFS family arabinose efflux permease [Homoserinimonas aerilata]